MKRDWQIIKDLLCKFRDDTISEYIDCIQAMASSSRRDMILEHIDLMIQDGLVQGIVILPNLSGYDCTVQCPRLTSLGQTVTEYLINNSIESIIFQAKNANLPVSIEMIKSRIGI